MPKKKTFTNIGNRRRKASPRTLPGARRVSYGRGRRGVVNRRATGSKGY